HRVLRPSDLGVQHLDGHAAVDPRVLAFVHGAHPSFAEETDDPVLLVDDVVRSQRHEETLVRMPMVPWGSPRCYGRNARFEQAAKPLRSALAAEPARERPGGHEVGSAAATRPQIPKNGWIPPAKRFRCPGVSEPSTADDGRSKPTPPGTAPRSDPSVSVHLLRQRHGRPPRVLRPAPIQCGFQRRAEGSVLYSAGGTVVLVTASVDETVPEWMKGRGRGWVTAEYQMHPRANPRRRERRDGRERPLGGRTREIERLIGRALRSAVALDALGERSITIGRKSGV